MSAGEWAKDDDQLAKDTAFKADFAKYSAPAAKEALDRTVKSLQEKKHNVKVFDTEKEACDFLASLLKDGQSVSMATSRTLAEIGFIDYLKTQDSRIINYKGQAAAAAATGNMAEYGALVSKGMTADMFVSGISALTEDGEVYAADLSGTRIGGWLAAKELVIVTGSNKIVANAAEAEKRLYDYQLKLESARVRVAYKVPASAVINKIGIKAANPFGPRTTIVIVKKSLGF